MPLPSLRETMKITITAKAVIDDRLGRLTKGTTVELPEHKALFYLKRNEAQMYDTKVIRERPYQAAGREQPSSVSPAAQALLEQTRNASSSGETKRPRRRAASSSSTQRSD